MSGAVERRIGHARQHAVEVRRSLLVLQQAPKPGMNGGHEQENCDDGAHRDQTMRGSICCKRTCPLGSTDIAALLG